MNEMKLASEDVYAFFSFSRAMMRQNNFKWFATVVFAQPTLPISDVTVDVPLTGLNMKYLIQLLFKNQSLHHYITLPLSDFTVPSQCNVPLIITSTKDRNDDTLYCYVISDLLHLLPLRIMPKITASYIYVFSNFGTLERGTLMH